MSGRGRNPQLHHVPPREETTIVPVYTSKRKPGAKVDLSHVAALRGDPRFLDESVLQSTFVVHDQLIRGLPVQSLKCFSSQCTLLAKDPALEVIMSSAPTLNEKLRGRRTGGLSSLESEQLCRRAAIPTKAVTIFGGS